MNKAIFLDGGTVGEIFYMELLQFMLYNWSKYVRKCKVNCYPGETRSLIYNMSKCMRAEKFSFFCGQYSLDLIPQQTLLHVHKTGIPKACL